MKKSILIFAMAFFAMFAVNTAYAQNPHFIDNSIQSSNNGLTVSGRAVGLGNNQDVRIVYYVDVEAQGTCTTRGNGMVVPGQTRTVSVEADDFFTSGQNGQVNFTVSITEEDLPELNFSCPQGLNQGATSISAIPNRIELYDSQGNLRDTYTF